MDDTIQFLTRGCVDVINKEELAKKLAKGHPLRVKLGVDPTSADLHLGHSVVLSQMRRFQDKGHIVDLVIGDFTAGVGDPSGRNAARPVLSRDEILKNARTYLDQVFKVLDQSKTKVSYNSSWLDPFVQGKDFLLTLSKITVAQTLEREDFKKRMDAGVSISVLEILYSIFQGYDSVALKADVEFGGTDQLFNLIMGRNLQRIKGQEPQIVMTVPLLVGLDGVKKMSKSYGNYVGFNDAPNEMFGKLMSISDEVMLTYYELLTSEDMAKIKAAHPLEAKKALAGIIVTRFHGADAAQKARENFENVFSKKELPDDIKEFKISASQTVSAVLVAAGIAASKNKAFALIDQGSVKLDGQKVEKDGPVNFSAPSAILQAGRRFFLKLVK